MGCWSVQDWLLFLGGLGTLIGAASTALIAIIGAWRTRPAVDDVKKDLADNTRITKAGTEAATANAKAAAEMASAAKTAALELTEQLNGALDGRISKIVQEHLAPLTQAFADHNVQDDRNMKEIRDALLALRKQ